MIPFDVVKRAATALKFTGDLTDEAAVRQFVISKIDAGAKVKYAGEFLTSRALQVDQPDEMTVVVQQVDGGGGMGGGAAPGPDTAGRALSEAAIQTRIDSAVDRAVRAANLNAPAGRPGHNLPEIKVRSADEVTFDIRQAQRPGRQIFKDYPTARAFHDYLITNFASSPHFGKLGGDATRYEASANRAKTRMIERGFLDKDSMTWRTYATFPNAAGGALTAIQFLGDVIKNVNVWGRATADAKQVTMDEAKVVLFKHAGTDFTVNYPEENATSSSQRNDWSNVTLETHTGVVVSKMSRQVLADSYIDLAMDVAEDYARAFARQEERALFIGDGTSTYANMTGVVPKFTLGTTASAITGGGTQFDCTDVMLETCIAAVAPWALDNAKWYCAPQTVPRIFGRLSRAAGGATLESFKTDGGYIQKYLGFDIVTTNAMNSLNSTGTSTVDVLFGDMSRGAIVGRRAGLEIASDESYGFVDNAIWMRGLLRHDINVHASFSSSTSSPDAFACVYQT